LPRLGICGRYTTNKTAAPAKQGSPRNWQIFKPNYARNKHKSFEIMEIRMFQMMDKAEHRLKLSGCQVTKPPLKQERCFIENNFLYRDGLTEAQHILYIENHRYNV
jgi:hypothetical protein